MKKETKTTAWVLVAFAPYYLWLTGTVPDGWKLPLSSHDWSFPVFNLACGLWLLALTTCMHGRAVWNAIGLRSNAAKGAAYALLCTLPMFLYGAAFGRCTGGISVLWLFNTTVVAGFFEELFFRGLFFGQLFRCARWGFLPAALLVALIFGCGHLYQSGEPVQALMACAVTALGSLLFSWIYVETGYNLWCSVFLHVLMNLAWAAFAEIDNGAVGTWGTNICRLLSLLLAIGLIVWHKHKANIPYAVNARTLWRGTHGDTT